MTTLYHSESKEYWDDKIKDIEEQTYTAEAAKKAYGLGELKDGHLFILSDGYFPRNPNKKAWVVGVFINDKFFYVRHSEDDARLKRLKRLAVAHLLDIVKRRWVDTRQAPWLPKRTQNVDDPNQVLYGADSSVDMDDEGKFAKDKQILGRDEAESYLEEGTAK